ncbi:MAG: catecholate siderophore receptor Fiu [Burkholderiaceae bacterium]
MNPQRKSRSAPKAARRRRADATAAQPRQTALAAALVLAMSAPAIAQTQPAPGATPPERRLKEVAVEAAPESYRAERVSSPKQTQPLVDTPQTISVIRQEMLQEQGATSLTEALRNTPGITLLLGEGGNSNAKDNIIMRGFDTTGSIFVDGVRDLGNFARDTFYIDQVEVVKGPAGADNGRGEPSGYINLSSKLPRAENFMAGSLSLGTGHARRATADLNRRFGETNAFRINLMKQDSGVAGRDHVQNDRWGVAPSVAFGLGTPTRITFDLLHMKQDNRPDGGVSTVGLPGYYNAAFNGTTTPPGVNAGMVPREVDSSNYYGSLADFERVKADMFTARIEHDLAPGTTLRNTTRYGRAEQFLALTSIGGATVTAPDPADWTVSRSRHFKFQRNEILTNQTNVTSKFNTGALQHSLSAGLELIHEKQFTPTLANSVAGTLPAANLYSPNVNDAFPPLDPQRTGATASGSTTTVALYAFDTLKITERFQVNGGVRWEKYKVDYTSLAAPAGDPPTQTATQLSKSDSLMSWKIGALYKPAPNGSIYAAYSTSQLPPGGANFALSSAATNINNPNLDPSKGKNIEVGTKWDLLDRRLSVAAALFRSEKTNDLTQTDPTTGDVIQYGKKRVQGVELSAVGQITPAWAISTGLARMKTEVEAGTATQTGASLNWSPKMTFTAWTTYKFPFGLTIGGGARYVDSVIRSVTNAPAATANMLNVPDYWVFDAMASYQVNRNLTLQLNIYNLADKHYIAALNNNGNRYIPGLGRSALLSAHLKF